MIVMPLLVAMQAATMQKIIKGMNRSKKAGD